jgi:hypothetical protein
MAEIENLVRGQMPPDGQDWIMVEAVGSGGYLVHTNRAAAEGRAASSTFHGPFVLASALDRAHELATKMALDRIFAKGLPHA